MSCSVEQKTLEPRLYAPKNERAPLLTRSKRLFASSRFRWALFFTWKVFIFLFYLCDVFFFSFFSSNGKT